MSTQYRVKHECSKLLHYIRSDYLYQMAHLCIINSTESATWFNNFQVLNIFMLNTADNKISGWWTYNTSNRYV